MATKNCLVCGRPSDETPIITLEYKASNYFICTQHLPILVHDPGSLADLLPGAENLQPSDHKD